MKTSTISDLELTVLTDSFVLQEPSPSATLRILRERIYTFDGLDEHAVMASLAEEAKLEPQQLKTTQTLAAQLAKGVRKARLDSGGVDLLTQEFTLDSREGVALMCLAEAMLRVPDTETRNKLIRDKIVDQDWQSHVGNSPSLFVNASAWGLALTGKILKQPDEKSLASALTGVLRTGGERVVRAGVAFAMKLLGKQFVTGQTIEEALGLAQGRERLGYRYTYDMLGESALTSDDADAYYEAYAHTIEKVGRAAAGRGAIEGPGVSVKLTGLHPRYEVLQRDRVLAEMYPRLLALARAAKRWNIGFHLDQEEAARFPLTLEMLERLAHEPELAGWEGLGISLQAYQKRGRAVIDWVIALGRETKRRIFVRLVKGAYWDTEIKRCQAEGSAGYPVFTRKVHSDVSYLACTKALFAAPDAVFPQFATHNAFSIAAVHTLGVGKAYEFQCLHGMGESVYDQVVGDRRLGRACRVYAPVGRHATLLAYLVRRLLENGANSSFVNQVVDTSISIEDIVADPVATSALTGGLSHPAIPMPTMLLPWRSSASAATATEKVGAGIAQGDAVPLTFGHADADSVMLVAAQAGGGWSALPVHERAQILVRVAERLEQGVPVLQSVLVHESGVTLANASEELRNAADLCRFYAAQALSDKNLSTAKPRGPVVVLAPMTSPLAWPVGQIAAALVTGNAVVFKPTSLANRTGWCLVGLFHANGVPPKVLQLAVGDGRTLGAALVAHPYTAAVLLAGSRGTVAEVARNVTASIQVPVLLARSTPCNAMVVDSSALPEQVITDAVTGAFDGAGRQAGALKILCVQDVVAPKVLEMLCAMLNERGVGDALASASDIGPLPHAAMCQTFEQYLNRLAGKGYAVTRAGRMPSRATGAFVQPAIVDLGSFDQLHGIDIGVVGPVLHVVRWSSDQLEALISALEQHIAPATLGLHTRIHETAGQVSSLHKFASIYVNRAVHGTRTGMQVDGASTTDFGPSPTGPLYLRELVRNLYGPVGRTQGPFAQSSDLQSSNYLEYPVLVNGRLKSRSAFEARGLAQRVELLERLSTIATSGGTSHAERHLGELRALANSLASMSLPSLSGEENTLVFVPRGPVLCKGPSKDGVLAQVMVAIACGASVVLSKSVEHERYLKILGAEWCQLVDAERVFLDAPLAPVAVLGEAEVDSNLVTVPRQHAKSSPAGVAIPVLSEDANGRYPWWRLVIERQITINVSASGGNTQLAATGQA
ncbi:proline dehydrogenase family protein [Rhodoferax sp. WC2427]|uniref:proline dehydrogenase family protein n=1 Tax=Rhodoferax sp. WC2427 TaxID=3234144 RepID=UPI0034664F7A